MKLKKDIFDDIKWILLILDCPFLQQMLIFIDNYFLRAFVKLIQLIGKIKPSNRTLSTANIFSKHQKKKKSSFHPIISTMPNEITTWFLLQTIWRSRSRNNGFRFRVFSTLYLIFSVLCRVTLLMALQSAVVTHKAYIYCFSSEWRENCSTAFSSYSNMILPFGIICLLWDAFRAANRLPMWAYISSWRVIKYSRD